MTTLYHKGKPIASVDENWQTRANGDLKDRYDCYVQYAGDGKGNDLETGEPLKTFDEWMGA